MRHPLEATLRAGRARLLAVFPHPDDESWAAGGLLARTAAAGSVKLVTLTRGESGADHETALSGAALGDKRARELATATATLGVADVTLCDLGDGQLTPEAVAAALAPWIAAAHPEVLVTFSRDGAYGHRDHTACVEGVLLAAACPVLAVALPTGLLAPLRRAFAKRHPALLDPRFADGPIGQSADLVLPLTPAEAALKRTALTAHKSQLRTPDDVDGFLGAGVIPRLLAKERYHWLVRPEAVS